MLTKEQIDLLVKNKIIPENTPVEQIQFFSEVCSRKKLDPFQRQIHLIKRREKDAYGNWRDTYTIQAGIDGMRAIAQRNCKIISYKRWVEKREDDLYGICEIQSDRGTYYDELPYKEYVQTKSDGTPTAFWKKFPQTMIKKCAEESVLRMMVPEDLSGIYGDDEMAQADSEPPIQISQPKVELLPKVSIEKIDNSLVEQIMQAQTIKELSDLWAKIQNPVYLEFFTQKKRELLDNEKKKVEEQLSEPIKEVKEKVEETKKKVEKKKKEGESILKKINACETVDELREIYNSLTTDEQALYLPVFTKRKNELDDNG